MKILFNCSSNFVGGGVQTTSNFILSAVKDESIDWYFAVSEVVYNEVSRLGVVLSNCYIFKKSPSRSKKERIRLFEIEKTICPDLVYTMTGPAYVKFSSLHVLGCTDGHLTHANWLSFNWKKHFLELSKELLLVLYKMHYNRFANHWIFQTEVSRKGFSKRMLVPIRKTSVVPNASGNNYKKYNGKLKKENDGVLSILVPSAGFMHKNLEIIPDVAKKLEKIIKNNKFKFKFKFILTLPNENKIWKNISNRAKELNVDQYIENNGPFSVSEGPELYYNSFAVFLPTLLETFSAVFVESMVTGTPLIVSDRDFAKDICKEGVLYFNPKSAKDAAKVIFRLFSMKDSDRNSLIEKGYDIVGKMPDIYKRYELTKQVLLNVFENNSKK